MCLVWVCAVRCVGRVSRRLGDWAFLGLSRASGRGGRWPARAPRARAPLSRTRDSHPVFPICMSLRCNYKNIERLLESAGAATRCVFVKKVSKSKTNSKGSSKVCVPSPHATRRVSAGGGVRMSLRVWRGGGGMRQCACRQSRGEGGVCGGVMARLSLLRFTFPGGAF